jgi:dTDP-glucose pyrophosphorylase
MSVYDEPMIYYWFSTRLLAAIREIPIIATNRDQPACRAVPCGGSDFGGKF